MAIKIEHRFLDRLLPGEAFNKINYVIIGTFNPGIPFRHLLTKEEKAEFSTIEQTPKFKRFSAAKNYYDRPQNRFWKIMDLIHNQDFYKSRPIKTKHLSGLKFYSGMDRNSVFERQTNFCLCRGVFITDIVRSIEPSSLAGIYKYFSDADIERATCEWNTDGILTTIEKYKPMKVLINLKVSNKTIPNISFQIERIKQLYHDIVFHVDSTSGNAGNTYTSLLENWSKHFV